MSLDVRIIKKQQTIKLVSLSLADNLGFVAGKPGTTSSRWISNLKLFGFTLLLIVVTVPMFQAFEAHVVNVTATPVQIDPPVMTPPGPVAWDDTNGGTGLSGEQHVFIVEFDNDATHVYYTYGAGDNPATVPDPVCGDVLGGPKSDIHTVDFNSDFFIKAIACDGTTATAHKSLINTKIYSFGNPIQPTIESLIIDNPPDTETPPPMDTEPVTPREETITDGGAQ